MRNDDDPDESPKQHPKPRWTDFECLSCTAQNVTEPFGSEDEIMCQYCGASYRVKATETGKPQMKEI